MKIFRWLLLFVLCVAIPAAFAADVKISALPAGGAVAGANLFAAVQSGTTNRVTADQIATFTIANVTSGLATVTPPLNGTDFFVVDQAGTVKKVTADDIASLTTTNINGPTGTAGGRETWQTLNANCAGNKTATLATCMTTNGLPAGTYRFEYTVIWQQNTAAASGIKFMVGTDSLADTFVASWLYPDQGTSASAGTADQLIAATAGAIYGHQSVRTNAATMGPNAAADTANANIMSRLIGVIRITKPTGTASLYMAAAIGASGGITVASGTTLNLRRVL